MRGLALILTGLALLAATGAKAEPSPEDLAKAARAAGCLASKAGDDVSEPNLEAAPRGVDGRWIIATVNHDFLAETGSLCVGLLKGGDEQPYERVAAAHLTIHPETSPSRVTAQIDTTPYDIAPGVTAFGVLVTSEINTETVNAGGSTLYLFRRQGDRLAVVFQTLVEVWDIDKVTDRSVPEYGGKLRVSPHMTHGFHDLIVTTPHARARRFEWIGDRYEAARRR